MRAAAEIAALRGVVLPPGSDPELDPAHLEAAPDHLARDAVAARWPVGEDGGQNPR